MDIYLGLKALHIISIVTWVGGMLLLGVTYRYICPPSPLSAENKRLARHMLKWDQWVTQPAIFGAWAFGLSLAYIGGWFSSPWLMVKLVIVIFLSAIHGMQSGRLRRYVNDPARVPPAFLNYSSGIVLVGLFAVVVLVVTKPF